MIDGEICFNLNQWKKGCVKKSMLWSGGHIVLRSGAGCVVMIKDIKKSSLSEILLNKRQLFRCRLCLALVAILFGGVEPFRQFCKVP